MGSNNKDFTLQKRVREMISETFSDDPMECLRVWETYLRNSKISPAEFQSWELLQNYNSLS